MVRACPSYNISTPIFRVLAEVDKYTIRNIWMKKKG